MPSYDRRTFALLARAAIALAASVFFLGCFPGPLQAPPQVPTAVSAVPVAPASERAGTGPDFAAVEATALDLGARFGPDRVLLVFDCDNTLLRMNQDLGSDEWYSWQRGLPDADPAKVRALAEAQGLLFDLSAMHPPEPGVQPRVVADLQGRGFAAIVLTGRSPVYRSATERELARNGYDFTRTPLPPREGVGGTFAPYDPRNAEAAGFVLPCDRERGTLPGPQPVSYQGGVMMTSGQDKGLMLRALLARGGRQFAAILFVDDSKGNLDAVSRAFACTAVEVTTVLYARGRRAAGIDGAAASDAWRKLRGVMKDVFAREVE